MGAERVEEMVIGGTFVKKILESRVVKKRSMKKSLPEPRLTRTSLPGDRLPGASLTRTGLTGTSLPGDRMLGDRRPGNRLPENSQLGGIVALGSKLAAMVIGIRRMLVSLTPGLLPRKWLMLDSPPKPPKPPKGISLLSKQITRV